MSPPRIGSAPRVVSPAVQSSKPAALKPTAQAPDTTFDGTRKKKIQNLTGGHKPVPKGTLPVKAGLAGDVAKLRAAAQGGASAPKLSGEAKAALDQIKRVSTQGMQAVAEVMAGLEPEVAKEVFQNLPGTLKAEISRETPFGLAPVAIRMAQVQTLSNADLSEISESMRLGAVMDPALQLSVATELAARTKWGQQNPEVVDFQRKLVVEGKVSFEDGRGAGRTKRDGEVSMDHSLGRSPEALAALLAHEATHSHHAVVGGGMNASIYAEETAGNLASAQVWNEIGVKDDGHLTKAQLDGLNEYAEQYRKFGEDGVQARVAVEYASEAANQYEKALKNEDKPRLSDAKRSRVMAEEKPKVADVIAQLERDPGAMKATRPEYVKELVVAVLATGGEQSELEKLGRAFKNLPEHVKAMVPFLIGHLDAEVKKTVLGAMK